MSATVPGPARLLGGAGLLPTVACFAAMLAAPPAVAGPSGAVAVAYGAAILSFLGGAWWGLASRGPIRDLTPWLAVSVLPSLLAAGLLLAPVPAAAALLGAAFLASPLVDRRLDRAGLAPDWWLRLRLPLSVGMGVLHLAISAVQAQN